MVLCGKLVVRRGELGSIVITAGTMFGIVVCPCVGRRGRLSSPAPLTSGVYAPFIGCAVV
jgi:hypothetical protein